MRSAHLSPFAAPTAWSPVGIRRPRLRRAAQGDRAGRGYPLRPPQGRPGRQGGADRQRHHHQLALPPGSRCPSTTTLELRGGRLGPRPRDGSDAASAARWSMTTSGPRAFPVSRRDDGGRRSRRLRHLTLQEILDPKGWILLSFLMDPRTGLGRFRDFRISNYQLMMHLIYSCRDQTIDEIFTCPT